MTTLVRFLLPLSLLILSFAGVWAQDKLEVPVVLDPRISTIAESTSAERIEKDIRKLAGFGTRNTFSDTLSETRGIGAARRWIKQEFDQISKDCGDCLEVFYQRTLVTAEGNRRIPKDTWIVNVIAIQRLSLIHI